MTDGAGSEVPAPHRNSTPEPLRGRPPGGLSERPKWASGPRWWILVGALAAASVGWNLIGIAVPLPWRDESATWLSTDRTFAELGSMLGRVDAVHGIYYTLLRVWVPLFSDSLVSLRMFSALGVGVGLVLVMQLAVRMLGPVAALGAGLLYGILPPLTWAAVEARSYSWAAVFSCSMVLAFWVAQSRSGWWHWVGYSGVAVLAVHGFLYNFLVLAALPLAIGWLPRGRRLKALVSTAAAGLISIPFGLLVVSQAEQVSWLATYPVTAADVTMGVFWGTMPNAQYVGTALLLSALVVGGIGWARGQDRAALVLLVGWLIVPVSLLIAVHPWVQLYHRRYLLLCLPAVAIGLGLLFERLRLNWLRVVMLVLVVVISLPGFQRSREADSKLAPAVVADKLANKSSVGDGLYVVDADVNSLRWTYPDQVRGLLDLSVPANNAWRSRELFPPSLPIPELGARLDGVERVWIWALPSRVDDAVAAFAGVGYQESDRIRCKDSYRTVLVLVERVHD